MTEAEWTLYLDILQTLERIGAPYVVIGAFAGISYGVTRVTADVDIVVDLGEGHIQALAEAYPPPRFYADPEQMRNSIRLGILFNIIDTTEGRKVDLIPVTMKPGYDWALHNRIRREVPLTWWGQFHSLVCQAGGCHRRQVDGLARRAFLQTRARHPGHPGRRAAGGRC